MIARWQRLRWEARRAWAWLDYPALTALAAVALWSGIELTVNAPLAARQEALAAARHAREAQQPVAKGSHAPVAPRQWLAFFPADDVRERDLQRLQGLLARHGLRLLRADYRSTPVPALPLQRFSATLQLQGSYAAQRRVLHDVLAAFPHATVSRISLERDPDLPGLMRITLELDFHFRAAPAAGGRA